MECMSEWVLVSLIFNIFVLQADNYEITYAATGSALAFFSYNPGTGQIFVERDLGDDNSNSNERYTVSLPCRYLPN